MLKRWPVSMYPYMIDPVPDPGVPSLVIPSMPSGVLPSDDLSCVPQDRGCLSTGHPFHEMGVCFFPRGKPTGSFLQEPPFSRRVTRGSDRHPFPLRQPSSPGLDPLRALSDFTCWISSPFSGETFSTILDAFPRFTGDLHRFPLFLFKTNETLSLFQRPT